MNTAILIFMALLSTKIDKFCNGATNLSGTETAGDATISLSTSSPLNQFVDVEPAAIINDNLPTIITPRETEEDSVCYLEGNIGSNNEDTVNFTLNHHLFNSDAVVPGIIYQVVIVRMKPGPPILFSISSSIEGSPAGTFSSTQQQNYYCGPHVYKAHMLSSEAVVNWTLQTSNDVIKPNITFVFNYTYEGHPILYRLVHVVPVLNDCQLYLVKKEATISDQDIPYNTNCQIWFPIHETSHGLVAELVKLNVQCSKGYIYFSGLNATHQHFKSQKQANLCGKLEELPESDRHVYFPSSHVQRVIYVYGNPVFSISYHLVDYCYNVTFFDRNGSFEIQPARELQCTFRIYLPYGNRIALNLRIGGSSTRGSPDTNTNLQDFKTKENVCEGLLTQLQDGDSKWSHCTKPGDVEKQIEIISRENKVLLNVTIRSTNNEALGLKMSYRAEPIDSIVGECAFGWVLLRQFCVAAMEGPKLPWAQAEIECSRKGGHLASIRSEHDQSIIDNLLINSPEYRDHNSYWIGASDKAHEGDFRWIDGFPFSYTNWFPGWAQNGYYNKQPNDDGLSEQDCVEVRRAYSLPSSSTRLTSSFMWNDRDCSTPNYFICERLHNDNDVAFVENSWIPECNKTILLSREQPKSTVSSPGFPRQYPNNVNCDIQIMASPGYNIILDFEEFVLEEESSCSYDYLIILEKNASSAAVNNSDLSKRICGDWSSKLKLLRYVSQGSRLILRFSSDYSHRFGGFKARISIENAIQCEDDRFIVFNGFCYLIVSYPEATWNTSQQICAGLKASLSSLSSAEEERFITTSIRKSSEYRTSAFYWLGANSDNGYEFRWIDESPMDYKGWFLGDAPTGNDVNNRFKNFRCLSLQWIPTPTPLLPSGLYWRNQKCNSVGGYICKRPQELVKPSINFNRTFNGTEGKVSSPNYPGNYYNNLNFSIKITGPDRTRLVIQFDKIDIEFQADCLYDYIEIKSIYKQGKHLNDKVRWCGAHETEIYRFNFVSETNQAEIFFHSDYSITGNGFSLTWYAADVSTCPKQTLTAKEGSLMTPNYPHFLLSHLDCSVTILAPPGKRIWLEFVTESNKTYYEFEFNNKPDSDFLFQISLGKESPYFAPFQTEGLLTDGNFISRDENLKLTLKTGDYPQGIGFHAIYKIVNVVKKEKIIILGNYSSGTLLHLNYPDVPPVDVEFTQHFIAPLGNTIALELYSVKFSDSECSDENGIIEVYDNYSDTKGTTWKLCSDSNNEEAIMPQTPIYISSFLNTLHIKQTSYIAGVPLNGSLRVQVDQNYKSKLMQYKDTGVESCDPNPCHNGGKCITKKYRKYCQCLGYYTGLFCALTKCELEPCAFGTCELTDTSYKCHCRQGYVGSACDQKRKPCEDNPCESRGTCVERGDSFQCHCHAWWEGPRCEKRMLNIPYKPLSERMFHEPFWLGLMTVFVVMGVIGLVWCAKRHFPEKIEKLLAEEDGGNRIPSLRSASVREQLAAAAAGGSTVTITPNPGPGAPRSIFGRLGIRKPSILSLTSPHASGYVPATARTFSLDDLLKPPPRRTPSPKKKRNNSTPTKKSISEKKQILQQLVSPVNKQTTKKIYLGELIQLNNIKPSKSTESKPSDVIKTSDTKQEESSGQTVLNDPKLEKKVTFARLLNKVSAEMSSGSEMELGIMQTNRIGGCLFARPSSTPPSPDVGIRSPNSTSSNQGSDSITSFDLAIPSALSSSISDLLINKRNVRLPNGREKPASADSILAMFRNFSSSSAGANLPSSLKVSPSTTPTSSSPQDDIVDDDESVSSSVHTPVSFSSGLSESSIVQHSLNHGTIEVSVLDPLSAHKSSSGGDNLLHPPTILLEIPSTINSKCLSPIRELPTPLPSPMPSPALSPIMRRSTIQSSLNAADSNHNRISVDTPNISINCSEMGSDGIHCSGIVVDPQAEDGLIMEEAAAMKQPSLHRLRSRSPPVGQSSMSKDFMNMKVQPPSIVIPTLTIQTPSPIHSPKSSVPFLGSPPPHKSLNETCFQFSSSMQSKKMFKDLDKPTSLDLPFIPPIITVTCNLSEAESDTEPISPAIKSNVHLSVMSHGMTYLSPFPMGNCGDHTASESNLSSSGYSSMASPGPSRCGSSNPLCPSEVDDQGCIISIKRRQSLTPCIKFGSKISDNINESPEPERREHLDSVTSDDPLLESNDEGIDTDHIDEKIDDGKVKSAKELEVFMVNENYNNTSKSSLNLSILTPTPASRPFVKCGSTENNLDQLRSSNVNNKSSLQLPSIVVLCDSPGNEKHLSPMSSRSESPLSDRTTGIERFSPQFYAKNKDILPFTDSDGLYDFPSSDRVNVTSTTHHKKVGRKREKKILKHSKTLSPTRSLHFGSVQKLLDVPNAETLHKVPLPRKLSPKRRMTRSQIVSSSSSSDSISSIRENMLPSPSLSSDTTRWPSPLTCVSEKYKKSQSGLLDNESHHLEESNSSVLTCSPDCSRKKVNRLRAISHQIRFLRRVELGLKKRGKTLNYEDDCETGEESPRATSPLLQSSKIEICKSSAINKMQNSNRQSNKTCKRSRHKREELLVPQERSLTLTIADDRFSD